MSVLLHRRSFSSRCSIVTSESPIVHFNPRLRLRPTRSRKDVPSHLRHIINPGRYCVSRYRALDPGTYPPCHQETSRQDRGADYSRGRRGAHESFLCLECFQVTPLPSVFSRPLVSREIALCFSQLVLCLFIPLPISSVLQAPGCVFAIFPRSPAILNAPSIILPWLSKHL
jgi:hypothetical protein